MRILLRLVFAATVVATAACHPRPILGGAEETVGGTIAGIVSATGGSNPVVGRKVTAVNVDTGGTFDTTTAANGGYTMKVPQGTYRLDVELREGETFAKRPDQTHVNNGDLDPARNFEITVRRP
jgi:hypothetical protein